MAPKVKDRGETVLYLYGVTKPPAFAAPDVSGVDGKSRIEPLECAGMVCWVSHVPALDFAENLARNMENLDWLAGASVRHQSAVAAIADSHDMLPARLGTVFLTESSLQADIRKRKPTLEADFRRIRGMEEWGVKVFAAPVTSILPAKIRTGKEYLQAKSMLLRGRRTPGLNEEVKQLARELEKLAAASAEGGKISGGRRDLQFQTTILIKRADRKKLENLLRRFSREWKDTRKIECSGPWPPYSFVSKEASAEASRGQS